MSQIQLNLSDSNLNIQNDKNVKADLKPRADLPPELQNARPSKGGILARIGAFLFGAGAAGGTAFGLGAGGLVGGLLGVGATAAAGIATGGAALIGGALALGIYVGIKAIVNHFRRAPAPEPRIVNQTQNHLPKNGPADDAFNKNVADAITHGLPLNGSLQNAVNNVALRYGKADGIQGNITVEDLIGKDRLEKFASEVRGLKGNVDAAKLEKLLDKYMNGNMELQGNMRKLNLPQEHMKALDEFLAELKQSYGDCAPKDTADLRKVYPVDMRLDAFVVALEKKVAASDVKVTPEVLKRMAKETIAPEMAVRSIAAVLSQDAAKNGLVLNPKAARAAAIELYTAQGRPPVASMAEARAFVDTHNDLAVPAMQKSALLGGLDKPDNMPPAHKAAFEDAVNGLRLAFGEKCFPDTLESVLKTNIAPWTPLRSRLEEMVKNGPVSAEEFGRAAAELLKPLAQAYAMAEALGKAMEQSQGISLTPAGRKALLNGVRNSIQSQMNGMKSSADATGIAASPVVSQFLSEIAGSIRAAEETYLPRVSDDAKPLLRNVIRSLPFDNASRPAALALIEKTARQMAGWRSPIDFGDHALEQFCGKMVGELNLFVASESMNQKIVNDIFSSFTADANRNKWTVNGKEINYMPAEHLIGEVRQLLPNTADLRFVTMLANQYTWTALTSPLQGDWRDSGDASAEDVAGTGLTNYDPITNTEGLLRQKAETDFPHESHSWVITVSPDKKTATIEMILPHFVCVDNKEGAPAGTVLHRMRIHCNLSAGSLDGKPRVTNVELKQEINAFQY